ncbi:MAG: hypothetical protein Q8R40_06655 [bacterium]|nr:hypothetical protein [bacterium]
MKIPMVVGMIAIFMLIALDGCKKHSKIVEEEEMYQEFTMDRISTLRYVDQESQTIFFRIENILLRGWFGEHQIKFRWNTKKRNAEVATVRLGNINFVMDEAKEVPAFKFVFSDQWLRRDVPDERTEKSVAMFLHNLPPIPNEAIYGVTIHLSRTHYMDLMRALIPEKEEK